MIKFQLSSLQLIIIFVAGIVGAFLSHWHGGALIHNTPKQLKNFLWALPFALGSYYVTYSLCYAILALAMCWAGKATGHGGGMDLGDNAKEPGKGRESEALEFLIIGLNGRIPAYYYDALLLSIVGVAAVSGSVLAFASVSVLGATIVATGGALKAVAYMVGWKVFPVRTGPYKDMDEATELGQALTGFFAYVGLALAVYAIKGTLIAVNH